MKSKRTFIFIFAIALLSIFFSANVMAVGATIENVFLDGVRIKDTGVNGITGLDRGEEFTLKVEVSAQEPVDDVQVEAQIIGIHNEDVSDISDTFDMQDDVTYIKKLVLNLPDRTDEDRYRLRVRVEDRDGSTEQKDYMIQIDAQRNLVSIKDVAFNPENEVKAGRSLLATVRVKNMGEVDEEGVKIKMSIPELGISVNEIIDELESDESITSDELYVRIPQCTATGNYDVEITASYDDGDETAKSNEILRVVEDPTACSGYGLIGGIAGDSGSLIGGSGSASNSQVRTSISIPKSRHVIIGTSGSAYPITLTNGATTSQSFTLAVSGTEAWGKYSFDPGNVIIISAKGTANAFLYVAADDDAAEGQYNFALSITTSAGTESVPLTAEVSAGTSGSKNGSASAQSGIGKTLEIGLILLVILLVVLGLVIAFIKMKDSEISEESFNGRPTALTIVEREEKPSYY